MTTPKTLSQAQQNALAAVADFQSASIGNRAYIVRSAAGRSMIGDGHTWRAATTRTVEGLFSRGLIVRAGATTSNGWCPCRLASTTAE